MKLSSIRVDSKKIEQGTWVNADDPRLAGLKLKVRGIRNSDWNRLYNKLAQDVPFEKRNIDGTMTPQEAERIFNECLKQTCLIDWDGLEDDKGKKLPFSAKLAAELIDNPDYRVFAEEVQNAAIKVGRGIVDSNKTDLKN
jgi:hypothetical protein